MLDRLSTGMLPQILEVSFANKIPIINPAGTQAVKRSKAISRYILGLDKVLPMLEDLRKEVSLDENTSANRDLYK